MHDGIRKHRRAYTHTISPGPREYKNGVS
eukprot:COSAG05_NODE_24162_length_253_cov_0.857143_1_plen_28_part_10